MTQIYSNKPVQLPLWNYFYAISMHIIKNIVLGYMQTVVHH